MSVVKSRPTASAVLVLSLGLAACGGDDVLGTPDVAACTAGTLTEGSIKSGAITAESCELWEDYEFEFLRAESWTVNTKANTAYIVRVVPTGAGAANTFAGFPSLYRRNAAGDLAYATGYWSSYGPVNANGGQSMEMIFSSPRATTVSVRVSATQPGPYDIELVACPITPIDVGAPPSTQEFTADDCVSRSWGGLLPEPTPLRFWSFRADSGVSHTVTVARTAGAASFYGLWTGPDMDFGCYTGSCISTGSGIGGSSYNLVRTPLVDATYTIAIAKWDAGALTASARVITTPVTLMDHVDSKAEGSNR